MGILTAGQVVIVHFPFSDLTASKLRPAVVLAEAGRGDWILCQITSKSYSDSRAVPLDAADFAQGSLRLASYVRPGKLFTAHSSLVANQVGELQPGKFSAIRDAVVQMIQKDPHAASGQGENV
jgi:mRNA interferase MazF